MLHVLVIRVAIFMYADTTVNVKCSRWKYFGYIRRLHSTTKFMPREMHSHDIAFGSSFAMNFCHYFEPVGGDD